MKLNNSGISKASDWLGYELPKFDRGKIYDNTKSNPTWLHFGAGNIFRAFPAACLQDLLNEGLHDNGLIVAEGFDEEIIERAYKPFDDLSLLVVLKADGSIEKKVIGSVVESLNADCSNDSDWNRLIEIFENPSLQMVSFTITEKGYTVTNTDNTDIADPASLKHLLAKIAALTYKRYQKGKFPVSFVSMDNCSGNGAKLKVGLKAFVEAWVKNGSAESGFLDYISDENLVGFPWSMIDKITPRPDANVQKMLENDGFEDAELIITKKNTYTSAFVNAEEAQYLVIEDSFPNGRPPLEKSGIIFTDRETVNKVEKMKVCTCLNPIHTSLAIFGCLLSYNLISEEMNYVQLKQLCEKIGYTEGMPVVINPGIINPSDFIKEVLEVRLPNPFMPDAPQRIAMDTSQKIPVRFGETLKAYKENPSLSLQSLTFIPLVFAGWCRYLIGINDNGEQFEPSPDPMLADLRKHVEGIALGESGPFTDKLRPILSNADIFGLDLYENRLADKVEGMFSEMVAGKRAVRETLIKYLG